jgi:hypothetical protein
MKASLAQDSTADECEAPFSIHLEDRDCLRGGTVE